ncbi:tetratricopeptide repeat protein [Dyella sp. ASV21]|uniref:tetratricopeptide repeat protein n=1 Tax=Dyella sp. ASV21 TaxID=2795114 RepID=UPI0018EABA47|nr:tetratricopeptide repeat protein [Dyella sp. ASV21]
MTVRPFRLLPCVLALTALAGLNGCGKTLGGYPNHAVTPSLVGPGNSARDDRTVYMDLIRTMQQQGAYYASLAHIDAYRQRFGDTPELRRLQADALRQTGQLDAARTLYRGLLSGGDAAAAWHGLGLVDAQQGNTAAAEQALQKATTLEPVNANYLSDLGYARLNAGQLDAAKDPLAMAAELDPTNPKVIANLALWALLSGDSSRADAIMQRGELSDTSRASVRRLATQLALRKPLSAIPASGGKPSATAASTNVTRPSDVPASMLQRFTSDATPYEARP